MTQLSRLTFRICVSAALTIPVLACGLPDKAENEPLRVSNLTGLAPSQVKPRMDGQIVSGSPAGVINVQLYTGNGEPTSQTANAISTDKPEVTLNLVNVSVAEAAQVILSDLLQINYSIDPSIGGSISIRSQQPVSRETALRMFELAAQQNNAVLVDRGGVYSIVPVAEQLTVGVSTDSEIRRGYSIRAVTLKYIGSDEMAHILRPFAGDGIVGVDTERNVLLLAGISADQAAWQKTIDAFDADFLANRAVGVIPIQGQSARAIVESLRKIIPTKEGNEPIAEFEAIEASNTVLIVARTPNMLHSAAEWVRRIAARGPGSSPVYAYDMRFAQAVNVAPVLGNLLGMKVEATGSENNSESPQRPAADSIQIEEEVDGWIYDDAFVTRIVAYEPTNTLLIYGPAELQARVRSVLHQLDVPQRQVMVEATIVEVALNDTLRYGVQYFFEDKGLSFGLSAGPSSFISPVLPGFSLLVDSPANIVVDALDDVTSVNVVSSPNLMIMNNQSARLMIGDQIPVATRQAQNAADDDEIFVNSVDFRDTGIIFEVTPRINSSGSVVLDISQEVSRVTSANAETLTPTIQQRVISSSIAVDSGETVVLGGLFSNEQTQGDSGIPLLKDIPYAGNLFGRTNVKDVRTELLVLITPRVVSNSIDARQVTERLRNRFEANRPPFYQKPTL